MNEITIPALVPFPTEGNLTKLIADRSWFEPSRVILSKPLGDGWAPVTAREFETEVRETAKGLIAAGINAGDRVGIMARTRYEWTVLDFAIWYAGAVSVPIYETSSAEQIDWILNDSHAVGLVVETPANRELAQSVLPAHTKHVWTITEDALGILRNTGSHISSDEIESRRNSLTPESLATLIYTSGTTGKPKGVQLTHGNFLS
ncbi:MAG: AMP-binding protein, partial [Candidatus Nanopelagicaceae bacterium]